jgi:hypothetical protein
MGLVNGCVFEHLTAGNQVIELFVGEKKVTLAIDFALPRRSRGC